MSKTFRRTISFLMSLVMLFTLLPVIPAVGAVNETGRQDISASELAGKAAGHVVSYSTEGTDIVKITVGLINTDYTIGSDISFQYDETVMKMYNCNDNKNMLSPGPAGFVIKNIPEWALSQDGKDNDAEYGFTSSKLTDMTCGIIDPSYTVTQMAKEGSIRKVLATVTSNVTLSEDYRAMFAFLDDVMRFKCIENDTVFEMYDITFKLVSGKTFDDVKYDTFDLYPESKGSSSGTRLLQYGTGRTTFETPTYFVGFPGVPEPEPEFGNVTFNAQYEGLTVSLSAAAKAGEEIAPQKTGAGGIASFTNIPAGSYNYTITGIGKGTDGKQYQLNSGKANGSVTVTKDATAQVDLQKSDFTEVSYAFPLTVKVTDMSGTAKTGGTVTVNGSTYTGGTVSATGTLEVAVTGVDGYQDRTVQVQLTPVAESFTQIASLTALSAYENFVTTSVSGGSGTITVKLSETAADVVLPLPMPDPSGDDALNTTDTPVESIKAQLTPKTETAKQELGAANVTLSAPEDIEVTVAEGKITGITVKANLPAGAYDVVITGSNMKTLYTTLNIVKQSSGDYVANVGGSATVEDGEIKEVTGGVTATEGGDNKVNFGNTVNDGATISGDGQVTGGTPVTGGITEAPSIKEDLTPTTLTGPVYVVDMKYDKTDVNHPFVEATVSLKNVDASISSGTFGIQYDASMFTAMTGKTMNDVVTLAGGITYAPDNDGQFRQLEHPTDTKEPGYIVFGWMREENAATNWTPGDTIFTIKLYGGADLLAFVDAGNFGTETVTVMPFTDTAKGKQAVADKDNAYVEQIWRTLGTDGNTAVKLDDAAAVKGGFYQIIQDVDDPDTPASQYDVRMEFILPEIENIKQSAPFRVQTGKNGTFVDIPGASVTLYADSDTFAADFAAGTATAITTLVTNSNGNVTFGVEPGTYHYTVTHSSYWAYPDGTTDTDKANDYDTFTIDEEGVITLPNSSKAHWATLNAAKEINPLMDAKSFHIVKLDTAGMSSIPVPRISSNNMAYNQQDYYFSIEPAAGYEWKESDMATVAASLVTEGAVRFENVDASATTEEGMYGSGTTAAITDLSWDAARGQFKIAASAVVGDSVGEDVDASVKTQAWYSPLRSGDIKITVKDEMFQPKEMTITATAGNGGKVTAKEPDPARTEGSSTYEADGTSGSLPITAGNDQIVETLNGGRTDSAVFNFKPDTSGDTETKQTIIDKVIVNGVEVQLTEAQKKDPNGYDYQFLKVTGDESISVTFATIDPTDPEEPPVPQSDPVITLVVGDHGKVTHGSDGYVGAVNTTVTATAGTDFAVVIEATPATDYQIDKVYLDDALVTANLTATTLGGANSDQPTKGTLTIPAADMGKGASHSIVVTFKPLDSTESTEIVVVSSVKENTLGSISKIGRNVYPVNYTPEYTMKPYDGLWELKYGYEDDGTTPKTGALVVTVGTAAPADKTADVTAPDASGLYHYTMEPLTADSTLVVAFNEVGYVVNGYVQIVAYGTKAKNATLVFERHADDDSLVRVPVTCNTEDTVLTKNGVKVLKFSATVPQGKWNVTVSKPGYLNCVISEFEVAAGTTDTIWFGGTSDSDVKHIILIPGDASQDKKNVGFADVGVVAAGWAGAGAKLANRVNGDLDESTYSMLEGQKGSSSTDMQYVISNYRRVASMSNKKYVDFCADGNEITT